MDARGTALVLITHISDELKAHIEANFARWCYGDATIADAPANFTFAEVAKEFMRRYRKKTKKTQLGMIGELLVHATMPYVFDDLENFAVYFNKEERNIKKGFDLTFFERANRRIWYAEVKSGRSPVAPLPEKARKLIYAAMHGLAAKLKDPEGRSWWDSALYDATATLTSRKRVTVKQLLNNDLSHVLTQTTHKWSGVLAAVVIHPHGQATLDPTQLADQLETLSVLNTFDATRMLVTQKSTIERVVQFLEESSA